jgi:hypothetical protein
LDGAIRDAELIAATLHDDFGVPQNQISLLTGEMATRQAIFDALTAVREQIQPGGQLLFFFSGDGTQASGDLARLERDARDEAMCPADASDSAESLILDDDLARWLEAIYEEKELRTIIVVIDCCPGDNMVPVPDSAVARFLPAPPGELSGEIDSETWHDIRGTSQSLSRLTGIYACAPQQIAFEGPIPDDLSAQSSGYLSHFLAEALHQAADDPAGRAWSGRQIAEYVNARLEEMFDRQNAPDNGRQTVVLDSHEPDKPLINIGASTPSEIE